MWPTIPPSVCGPPSSLLSDITREETSVGNSAFWISMAVTEGAACWGFNAMACTWQPHFRLMNNWNNKLCAHKIILNLLESYLLHLQVQCSAIFTFHSQCFWVHRLTLICLAESILSCIFFLRFLQNIACSNMQVLNREETLKPKYLIAHSQFHTRHITGLTTYFQ